MNDRDGIQVERTTIDDGIILKPVGDIDLARAPAFRSALTDAQADRPKRIVVDLTEVPYMDSSGVATLVEAMQRARAGSQRLVLAGPQQRVRSIFEIAKLDTVFTIVENTDAALSA